VAAVARLGELDRAKVRARFDERFAIERVAKDYLRVYQALPGVRNEIHRVPAPLQAQLARLSAPISVARPSLPVLHLVKTAQPTPAE
jgi:hypothetical protein